MRSLPRDLPALLLAAALLLTACGDDRGAADVAEDPAPSSTSEAPPHEAGAPSLLTLYSQSNAGGEVDPVAQPLDTEAAVAEFTADMESRTGPALRSQVDRLEVPEGQVPAGAVVAIGCEPPTTASIEVTDAGIEVTSPPVKSDQQCLVAVTTIAIIAADPDQL